MNLRYDKVTRAVGFGRRKVYSVIATDDGVYLIRTGSVGALKHLTANPADKGVQEIAAHEARLADTPLPDLLRDRESYFVRLEAIEDVDVKDSQPPEMLIKVTGSDHHLAFPYASFADVQALQRALNKWTFKK